MKSRPLVSAAIALAIFGAISMYTSNISLAQQGRPERPFSESVNDLIQVIQKLIITISPSNKDSELENNTNGNTLQGGENIVNAVCTEGFYSWPNSTTKKQDSAWDTTFIYTTANASDAVNQFIDVNGDGLVDYVYKYKGTAMGPNMHNLSTEVNATQSCVYLNNGNGWDSAYRCVTARVYDSGQSQYIIKYYGDCADTN